MKKIYRTITALLLCIALLCPTLDAQTRGRDRGGGGGNRTHQPASRPGQGGNSHGNRPGQGSRPTQPNRPSQGNNNRPGQGNHNRPSQGNNNRPGNRPGQGNHNRPSQGNNNRPGQGNHNGQRPARRPRRPRLSPRPSATTRPFIPSRRTPRPDAPAYASAAAFPPARSPSGMAADARMASFPLDSGRDTRHCVQYFHQRPDKQRIHRKQLWQQPDLSQQCADAQPYVARRNHVLQPCRPAVWLTVCLLVARI